MRTKHLEESYLAHLSDGAAPGEAAGHLKWCVPCQCTLADFVWLQREIAAALEAEAMEAPMASPDWEGVRRRLGEAPHERPYRRVMVAMAVGLTVCAMLIAPFSARGHGQAPMMALDTPAIALAPAEAAGVATGVGPDMAFSNKQVVRTRRALLPFVPPPTPPEQGA